jgi:GT2 family glycosyltransferase
LARKVLRTGTDNIHHVSKMLYSWRKSETSTAKNADSKPYAYINQLRALRDSVSSDEAPASVYNTDFMGFWQVKYHVQKQPKVSIIIPTKNNCKLIKNCVESIIEQSTYPNFELIIVDTGSTDSKTLDFYKSKLVTTNPIKIIEYKYKKAFNFSASCNLGVKESSGDYLLFLNNDTEVISSDWIEQMLGLAQRKEVGMVGCKLLFPDKRIQHAGVVLSERDIAFHPFYGVNPNQDIFINVYLSNIRNCSAVTAACSMVSKEKFREVGGFDEVLSVTYNDVDLCLRLLKKGYHNVYTPYAYLYHDESMSVGRIHTTDRDRQEVEDAKKVMYQRWQDLLQKDPYYNNNFIQHGPGYELPS